MHELDVLEERGCSDSVIKHCIAVSKKACEIGDMVLIEVDRDLIRLGALFHDIGRCKTHGIDHGVAGAEIARELGYPEKVVDIIERHLGAGISVEEAGTLELPLKDYTPKTPEEKIVSYADSLTFGTKFVSFEESLKKFKKSLGEDHPAIEKFLKLHQEIQAWMKNPGNY
ncbi:MAG: TIGR00295 family protein [Candidatus Hydrothermarchaeales archaeon]